MHLTLNFADGPGPWLAGCHISVFLILNPTKSRSLELGVSSFSVSSGVVLMPWKRKTRLWRALPLCVGTLWYQPAPQAWAREEELVLLKFPALALSPPGFRWVLPRASHCSARARGEGWAGATFQGGVSHGFLLSSALGGGV